MTELAVERGKKFREGVRRWDWVLVGALAGVMLFPEASRAWTLLAMPVVLLVQWWAWREVLPVTPLNPAVLLVAIMTGVSAFVTPDLAGSVGKITGVLLGIAVYFSVVRHSRNQRRWRETLILFALAGMGVAMVGLVGTNWHNSRIALLDAVTRHLPVRITGMAGAEGGIHPNELAGALLWVVPVVVLAGVAILSEPRWFASRSGRGKVHSGLLAGWTALLGVAILMSGGVLVLAQSRGGYLAMALTGVVLVVLILRGRWRWGAVGVLAAGVIGAGLMVQKVGMQTMLNQVVDSLPIEANTVSLNTLNWRVEIWSRAVWAIRDVPLTGLGMNVFREAIHLLYPTFQLPASYNLGHAHNEILQAALDLGLPGLVGFLALYMGAVGMLVPALRGKGTWRLLALGLLGGLLAHFIFGITDAVALGAKPGFLFWWLLGMVCGLYEQNRAGKVAQG